MDTGGIVIENFNISYIDDILEIENISFDNPWTINMFLSEFENETSHCKILLYNNKLTGYVIYRILYDESEILNIAVHPDMRGKKFGNLIIRYVCDDSVKKKCRIIFLEVAKNNIIARNLYRSFGFYEYAMRKKYYDNEDAILMKLDINE